MFFISKIIKLNLASAYRANGTPFFMSCRDASSVIGRHWATSGESRLCLKHSYFQLIIYLLAPLRRFGSHCCALRPFISDICFWPAQKKRRAKAKEQKSTVQKKHSAEQKQKQRQVQCWKKHSTPQQIRTQKAAIQNPTHKAQSKHCSIIVEKYWGVLNAAPVFATWH